MLVFLQTNRVSAIYAYASFYYHHMVIFFHAFVCFLLVPCMLKFTPLRVGVKRYTTVFNAIYLISFRSQKLLLFIQPKEVI